MSMEIDSPHFITPKTQKTAKERGAESREKKRKRKVSENLEPASPVKKQRSEHHSGSATNHELLAVQRKTPIASSFFRQTSSFYLPLPPISQRYALKGLCAEHLSPLILTYYPPFHGVIISYDNVRLSSEPLRATKPAHARSIDEYAASFVWLIADFIIFKPQKGNAIEGWVNLQNESNIGLLCLNFFNATIERRRLPKGWKWISGGVKPSRKRKSKKAAKKLSSDSDEDMESEEDPQGHFEDAGSGRIEGLLRFRVKNVETSRNMDGETSFLSIEGTLLSEEEEKELQEQEAIRVKEKGRRQPRHAMAGALLNGHDGSMDVDQPANMNSTLKHRAKY